MGTLFTDLNFRQLIYQRVDDSKIKDFLDKELENAGKAEYIKAKAGFIFGHVLGQFYDEFKTSLKTFKAAAEANITIPLSRLNFKEHIEDKSQITLFEPLNLDGLEHQASIIPNANIDPVISPP